MRVQLVAYTIFIPENFPDYVPHPYANAHGADELAEAMGRLDYLSFHRPNEATATNEGYLNNIINQGHFNVLEHASASMYIDGVSRNFTHELIRHRHFSFSEVSQRYVDLADQEFRVILPPALRAEYGEDRSIPGNALHEYRSIVEKLRSQGHTRKQARQAARYILPSGIETRIGITGNMRAYREMLGKRLRPEADEEFRQVAYKMLKILRLIAPNTFQDFYTEDGELLPEYGF